MSRSRYRRSNLDRFFDSMETWFPVAWGIGVLLIVGFWIAVVAVAIHFIDKFW